MTLLKLPLELTPSGFFKLSDNEDEALRERLRIFVLAGAGGYMKLPSPGISRFWETIRAMGISSRICSVIKDEERVKLEDIIREEVNAWLADIVDIKRVKLLGDQSTANGIAFTSATQTMVLSFAYASGKERGLNTIGTWNIREHWHAVH